MRHTNTFKINSELFNNLVPAHLSIKENPLVADTGATSHFTIKPNPVDYIHTSIPLTHVTDTQTGVTVLLPNRVTMQASYTGQLDILSLPPEVRTTHIFTELASGSLLSIGKLFNYGCSAYFGKYELYIIHNGCIIVQ